MPVIGAAAPAQDRELRKLGPELGIAAAQIGRIALVELGGLVELGVALGGGVCAQAADPIRLVDRLAEGLAARQRPSVSTVNEIAAGSPCCCAASATPIASSA